MNESLESDLKTAINNKDFQQALKLINEHGDSRYTSIFAFEEPNIKNMYMFDRESPDVQHVPSIMPVSSSYCDFVKGSGKTFIITDSLNDPRVEGHHKQNVFRSYMGVPIKNTDGSLWGTICYFDAKPNNFSNERIEILAQAAALLQGKMG